MATTTRSRGRKAAPGSASGGAGKAVPLPGEHGIAESLKALTGQMMGLAEAAMSSSLNAAGSLFPHNGVAGTKTLLRAGSFLKQVREGAGLSLDELGKAVDLKDGELLALAENGKLTLPFEVILRLAAILARNDPIPFVMNLTKVYSPAMWGVMESLGIGRLVQHAGREHEFVSIYRARDAARRLSDEEFERVKQFVESAFDLALGFAAQPEKMTRKNPAKTRGKG